MSSHSISSIPQTLGPAIDQIASIGLSHAVSAGVGAIAASVFTSINPIAGAIFAVSNSIAQIIIHQVADRMHCDHNAPWVRVSKFCVSFLGGIGAGILVTSLVGFPLTFTGGLILTAAMLATSLSLTFLFGAILSSAAIGIAAMEH